MRRSWRLDGSAVAALSGWRRAAQEAARTYKEWSAANWHGRHQLYFAFLDALWVSHATARAPDPEERKTLGAAAPEQASALLGPFVPMPGGAGTISR